MTTPLYTKCQVKRNLSTGQIIVNFLVANADLDPNVINFQRTITLAGTTDAPNNIFTSVSEAVSYYAATAAASMVTFLNGIGSEVFAYAGLVNFDKATQDALDGKAAVSHSHVVADLSDASTFGKSLLTAVDSSAGRTLLMNTQSHINDPVNNLATNYNVLSALLDLANGLNAANSAQNDMANKVRSILDALEANKILAP